MKTHDSSTFAALLAQDGLGPDTRVELRRQVLRAIVPLALVVAVGGLWAATAPLSGATPTGSPSTGCRRRSRSLTPKPATKATGS